MSTERIRAAFAYKAQVVPRNARKLREVLVREEAIVELAGAAARDVEPAVVIDSPYGRRTWLGYGEDLWLPLESTPGDPMSAVNFLEDVAAGRPRIAGIANPFHLVGLNPYLPEQFEEARHIEEMTLRSVVSDDREEKVACVSRLARNFLLLDDGRVLRRSPGPYWRCSRVEKPAIFASSFELPQSDPRFLNAVYFGVLRKGEADEFTRDEWKDTSSDWAESLNISVNVVRADCVPNHDAIIAARSIVPFITVCAMLGSYEKRREDDIDISNVLAAIERIYGQRSDVLAKTGQEEGKFLSSCPLVSSVTPLEIVAAVEGTRRFNDNTVAREYWDNLSGAHFRRFDVYEYERLGLALEVPDFAAAHMEARL